MIDGSWMTDAEREVWIKKGRKIGMARRTINGLIGRLKMMFKWGTKMQIIPPNVFHGLLAVDGLTRGRSEARENDDVQRDESDRCHDRPVAARGHRGRAGRGYAHHRPRMTVPMM
jgi:hypothetical protein